jgi:hypothetical protein
MPKATHIIKKVHRSDGFYSSREKLEGKKCYVIEDDSERVHSNRFFAGKLQVWAMHYGKTTFYKVSLTKI